MQNARLDNSQAGIKISGGKKKKRFLGDMSTTSDMQMRPL